MTAERRRCASTSPTREHISEVERGFLSNDSARAASKRALDTLNKKNYVRHDGTHLWPFELDFRRGF
jgi:hypothetical protein